MKRILESWRKFDEECDSAEVEDLAAFAHQGQIRRSGEPYISHPKAAAEFAKKFGYDDVVVDAALLHDTLEDYKDPAEMEEMIKSVCPEALPIVRELTHDRNIEYTDYVLSLSPQAVAVKMLDMYHNAQDLQPGDKQYLKYQNALTALGGKPNGINDSHWAALTKKLGVEIE
jgi:(p)ppGpp synthase/HD superfamily hydrolase